MDISQVSIDIGVLITLLGILKTLGEFLNEFALKITQLIQHLANLDSRIDLLEYKVTEQARHIELLSNEIRTMLIAKNGSQ